MTGRVHVSSGYRSNITYYSPSLSYHTRSQLLPNHRSVNWDESVPESSYFAELSNYVFLAHGSIGMRAANAVIEKPSVSLVNFTRTTYGQIRYHIIKDLNISSMEWIDEKMKNKLTQFTHLVIYTNKKIFFTHFGISL